MNSQAYHTGSSPPTARRLRQTPPVRVFAGTRTPQGSMAPIPASGSAPQPMEPPSSHRRLHRPALTPPETGFPTHRLAGAIAGAKARRSRPPASASTCHGLPDENRLRSVSLRKSRPVGFTGAAQPHRAPKDPCCPAPQRSTRGWPARHRPAPSFVINVLRPGPGRRLLATMEGGISAAVCGSCCLVAKGGLL